MGNSAERIPIRDLGDVIYYKQVKEYTDAEFETSKDLDRELKKGRIVVLEKNAAFRGSDVAPGHTSAGSAINLEDLKVAIREVMPLNDVAGTVKALLPSIAEIIRQEIAKAPMQYAGPGTSVNTGAFTQYNEAVYVPTISVTEMKSNIDIKGTETSADAAKDALKALRNMNKI